MDGCNCLIWGDDCVQGERREMELWSAGEEEMRRKNNECSKRGNRLSIYLKTPIAHKYNPNALLTFLDFFFAIGTTPTNKQCSHSRSPPPRMHALGRVTKKNFETWTFCPSTT